MRYTLHYCFDGEEDLDLEVEVHDVDYADFLFDQLLVAKRTDESYAAVLEMIGTLDLYEVIEDYDFLDWLTDKHEAEAREVYEDSFVDYDDVDGIYR